MIKTKSRPQTLLKVVAKSVFSATTDEILLRNIAIELQDKQVIGMMGVSGAGKSVLLNILFGISTKSYKVKPCELVFGYNEFSNFREYSSAAAAGSVFIPQDYRECLDHSLTVREQFKYLYPGKTFKDISDVMSEVELPLKLLKNYTHDLSGGQMQRLVFALSLISKPKVLVLDEIVSALDYFSEMTMWVLLKKLATNRTVVVITHNFFLSSYFLNSVFLVSNKCLYKISYNVTTKSVYKLNCYDALVDADEEVELEY